jgi:hypothetical protein
LPACTFFRTIFATTFFDNTFCNLENTTTLHTCAFYPAAPRETNAFLRTIPSTASVSCPYRRCENFSALFASLTNHCRHKKRPSVGSIVVSCLGKLNTNRGLRNYAIILPTVN